MANGKIFIGEIMGSMVDALNSVDSAMGDQVQKSDEMIAEMQNLNTSMANTIVSLITDVDPNYTLNPLVLNTNDIVETREGHICTISCQLDGVVGFDGRVKISSDGKPISIEFQINGGTWKTGATVMGSTSFSEIKGSFYGLKKNDVVNVRISCEAAYILTLEAGAKLTYRIVDIVSEGALIVVDSMEG